MPVKQLIVVIASLFMFAAVVLAPIKLREPTAVGARK